MKKLLFAGAAVLLLAAGCSSQTASTTDVGTQNAPAQSASSDNNQPATANTSATASAGDSSNASLNASLGNIDGQMNGLSSDSANVDSSVNAQQAP